jgi:hypothetical protein
MDMKDAARTGDPADILKRLEEGALLSLASLAALFVFSTSSRCRGLARQEHKGPSFADQSQEGALASCSSLVRAQPLYTFNCVHSGASDS